MNFSELDSFNQCSNLCNTINMLPNIEKPGICAQKEYGQCDDGNCNDEIVHMFKTSYDPDDGSKEKEKALRVSGNPLNNKDILYDATDCCGKYGCSPVSYTEAEQIIEEGCGIKKAFDAGLSHGLNEGLGYESAYNVGDLVKMADENIPQIFIVVCNDGNDIELSKPTANRNEMRVIGGGMWPRFRCNEDEISHKVNIPLNLIEYVIASNDNSDSDMLEQLCPGCCDAPISISQSINEAFDGNGFDKSPMEKAQQTKLDNSRNKTPNDIQPKVFDENGRLKENTEEIFNKINNKMCEMLNPNASCNEFYPGGWEVITSTKPIQNA